MQVSEMRLFLNSSTAWEVQARGMAGPGAVGMASTPSAPSRLCTAAATLHSSTTNKHNVCPQVALHWRLLANDLPHAPCPALTHFCMCQRARCNNIGAPNPKLQLGSGHQHLTHAP
jgi:hypothetical protein